MKNNFILSLAITVSLAAPSLTHGFDSVTLLRAPPLRRTDGNLLENRDPTCTGPVKSSPTRYWLDQQDHTGAPRGYAPYINEAATYPVYRNVHSYNAVGDGNTDDTDALQKAINAISVGPDPNSPGTRYQNEVTTRPALVFVPGGTYKLTKPLDLRLNTILVGDPLNRPVFKASSNFKGATLINGNDYATFRAQGTTNFFIGIKNIIIDTTSINPNTAVIALTWGVAQACQLTNIKIQMPSNSAGHVGIDLNQGSTISISDITIIGGVAGIRNRNQQVNFKNISFQYCTTALVAKGGYTIVVQGAKFDTCGLGVDISGAGGFGSVVILDSNSVNSGPVIKFHDSSNDRGDRNNQVVIENLSVSGSNNPTAIDSNGQTKLANAPSIDTWVFGNETPGGYRPGDSLTTPRSGNLLANGKFFTMPQPTYAEYASDQFVNVKAVPGYPVKGDGSTDDSASLNAILQANAKNCKISYFPYGVYVVKSTLFVPKGTRIVGEAWSVISGWADTFGDRNNPKPVVKIGNPNDVGVAQIQDMRFTVKDISPGAIIVQVNMAGSQPGDVAFWNSHITVGGAADTNVNVACSNGNTAGCLAAFAMVHLTSSSSCYIENMWGWTADHSLERGGNQNIATGRGLLVESTKATWLTGTAFEHNTLYNYNLHNAQNVYAGLQQTETPYWQSQGAQQNAPSPWTAVTQYGDPNFSWCARSDQFCRAGLAQNIDGGTGLFLYGAAFWTFFHGETQGRYDDDATICGTNCITNQARVTNTPKHLYWYAVNSKSAKIMILDNKSNPSEYNNPGGWSPGGVIAAYLSYKDLVVQSPCTKETETKALIVQRGLDRDTASYD